MTYPPSRKLQRDEFGQDTGMRRILAYLTADFSFREGSLRRHTFDPVPTPHDPYNPHLAFRQALAARL